MNERTLGAGKIMAAIAGNSFREAIRDRWLLSLAGFAVLMAGAALLFTQMSFGIAAGALINFSLAAITFLGALMAVLLGNQLVAKEIERRTAYALLAHPVRRRELVLGKFAGLLLALTVNTGLMGLALLAALSWLQGGWHSGEGAVLAALYCVWLELALLTAVSLFFSSFASIGLAAVFSLSLFLIGNFNGELRGLGAAARPGPGRWLPRLVADALPNFGGLNLTTAASHYLPVSARLLGWNSLYVLLYGAVMLILSAVIFEFRDLK